MRFVFAAVLYAVGFSVSANEFRVSRAMQLELLEEAKAQRFAAVAGRKAFEAGESAQRVEKQLYAAFHRWQEWPAPDVVKSALSGCASAVVDELGLVKALRLGSGAEFVRQKRRYVAEDLAACEEAIGNPWRAFSGILVHVPAAVIEPLTERKAPGVK